MKDIIDQISSLYEHMALSNQKLNDNIIEINKRKESILKAEEQAKLIELGLKNREAIVKKYEDYEALKKAVDAKNEELMLEKRRLDVSKKDVEKEGEKLRGELGRKQKQLDEMIALYKKKDLALNAREQALEERKKKLRIEVIEELKVNA